MVPLRDYFSRHPDYLEGKDVKSEESKDEQKSQKELILPVFKARNLKPKILEKHLKVFGCKDHGEDVFAHGKEGKGNMRFYIFTNKMGAYNKPTPMEIQVVEWDETFNTHPVWHDKSNFRIKDLNPNAINDDFIIKPVKTVRKRMNLDDQIEFSFLIGESIDFELSKKKFEEEY